MAVLETSMTSTTRENAKKTVKNDKKHAKKVLLVAQELKLARVLAGNNKTARDRAVKSLRKWFQSRASTIPFTEDDFLRLWKGLFYSMWMSDKPLIQEECAENISNLVHALPPDSSLLFFKCGLVILMNEWFGIDQLRLDKFLMFVRRLLRQGLFVLKNQNWVKESIRKFTGVLSETILDTETLKPMGLLMHFIEIYLEELAKVSGGDLPPYLTTDFVAPFIKQLSCTDDPRIIDHIHKHIFIHLIRQSDLGQDYEEKYKAWRNLGFPGSIDSMKKIEVDDEDDVHNEDDEDEDEEVKEVVYDPRAGRVDVDLPQIKFHPKAIARALTEHKFVKASTSKSRKCISELAEHFKKMASGIYPLGVKRVKLADTSYDTNIKKAVNRLFKFEKQIKGETRKKRKRRVEDEVELRGGKKIKLDHKLSEKVAEELTNHVISDRRKKKKRKSTATAAWAAADASDATPEKQLKTCNDSDDAPLMELESIFKRNSGTWFVTRSVVAEEQQEEEKEKKAAGAEGRSEEVVGGGGGGLFPKNQWEVESDDDLPPVKGWAEEETKMSAGAGLRLLKNPFATPTPSPTAKKVKINTKLNRSQEIDEHQAQIKSSPAIPYDANKKPSKPLLKTTAAKSPINPFYRM